MELQPKSTENLDILYSQYLANLKKVIIKLNDAQDINYCKRWIEALNNCKESEKIVRNCLISLMYQQLDQDGQLGEPFLDLSKIYCNLNDLFVEDDTHGRPLSSKSTINTIDFSEGFPTGQRGPISKDTNPEEIGDFLPITQRHLTQIDDLTKFIVNMRNVNQLLMDELKQLRKDKSLLEIKLQRKDTEMNKLMANDDEKQCTGEGEDLLSKRVDEIIRSYTPGKKCSTDMHLGKDIIINKASLTTNKLDEKVLLGYMEKLCGLLEEHSFSIHIQNDSFLHNQSIARSFLSETIPEDIRSRIEIYEFRIRNAFQSTFKFHRQLSKGAADKLGNILQSKSHVSTFTQTFALCADKSTTCASDPESLKIKLLSKCLRRLKKSRDKLAERYEKKIKKKTLQIEVLRKLWKLQMASIKTHLQMSTMSRSQSELFDIAQALELKYKTLVTDKFDDLIAKHKTN